MSLDLPFDLHEELAKLRELELKALKADNAVLRQRIKIFPPLEQAVAKAVENSGLKGKVDDIIFESVQRNGSYSKAAEELGIGRSTVYKRMRELNGAAQIGLCCLFLLTGCEAPKPRPIPPMPPMPKVRAMSLTPESVVTAQATTQRYLFWSYPVPMPADGVVFDIEFTSDLNSPWVKIGEVEAPPFGVSTDSSQGFFRIGAHKKQP